jgi:hypothetical protein
MIYLSDFQLGPHRPPCFYWKYPCFLFSPWFFNDVPRGKNPLKPLLILKKSKQVARRTSAPSYDPPRADSAGLLGEFARQAWQSYLLAR